MPSPARLVVAPGDDLQNVCFGLAFAAPELNEPIAPAQATLEFGDGQRAELGWLVMPSSTTWRDRRAMSLVAHTYAGIGPYIARLLWGTLLVEADVHPGTISSRAPEDDRQAETAAAQFTVESREGRAMERTVRVVPKRPEAGQRLRLDGGAGQVFWLEDEACANQACERRFTYFKTGIYTLALDLLDADGFWLGTHAQELVEIGVWSDQAGLTGAAGHAPTGNIRSLTGDQPESARFVPEDEGPEATADETEDANLGLAWLPYRYVRPMWGWLRTYTGPGGTNVARVLAAGTYLSIHAETRVGDALWFQTAGNDWISAGVVDVIHASELRGIVLPGPKSEAQMATSRRQAVVTAPHLNERASPGVRADNPPLRQLPSGTSLAITDSALCGDSIWYQVQSRGWVQGTGLRIAPSERKVSEPDVLAPPLALPAGWVTSPSVNLRASPGITQDNPPVGRLRQGQAVAILGSQAIGSAVWHRIGNDRWVDGTWVSIAAPVHIPTSIGPAERWLAINLNSQTAVAYEGDRPVYAALASTGLPGMSTPRGLYHTERQVPTGRISGGNPTLGNYYDLEDVPWIIYFYGGYAVLGAYWHNGFGQPRSHGCVNLSPYDAWWIYRWGQGQISVYIY
jgi:hypothetical protein